MKTNDIPLKSPIKLQQEMQKKILNFPKFVRFLGHFLKKQCFWKMGVAGIKQLPRPSKIASFSGNLNGEALLKVSFKNIDWFQKYKALNSITVKKVQFTKEKFESIKKLNVTFLMMSTTRFYNKCILTSLSERKLMIAPLSYLDMSLRQFHCNTAAGVARAPGKAIVFY